MCVLFLLSYCLFLLLYYSKPFSTHRLIKVFLGTMSPIIYGQICMITFCREQLRIVKQPGLIWKQPTKIDWQKWVLITMPCLLTTAEFNFHGLNITKITQKWIHSCGFSIRWERQALEHCNCVLYWLTNSFLQKKKRYSKHFTYRDILWQLWPLS